MKKATKAKQFDIKTKKRIYMRDNGCIFCRLNYHMEKADDFQLGILDVMHIVNKSQSGLGIEENGILGCRYHHAILDNGNKGLREEMQQIIEDYMKSIYPNWDRRQLIYKKGYFEEREKGKDV